jgi:hypothetical protein
MDGPTAAVLNEGQFTLLTCLLAIITTKSHQKYHNINYKITTSQHHNIITRHKITSHHPQASFSRASQNRSWTSLKAKISNGVQPLPVSTDKISISTSIRAVRKYQLCLTQISPLYLHIIVCVPRLSYALL